MGYCSFLRCRKAHANPATGILVLEDDPRLLKRGLDAHQGRDDPPNGIGAIRQVIWLRFLNTGLACDRLFGLFWLLMFAQSHARAAAVLVDEFDAGQFQGTPDCQDRVAD